MQSFPNSLSLSLICRSRITVRKAGSCNFPYCASGFKILLVRVSDRRNHRDDDQWIPRIIKSTIPTSHPINLLGMTSRVNREFRRCVSVLVTSIRIRNGRRCPVDSVPSTRLFLRYIQSLSLESGVDEVYVSLGDLNRDLESEDARSWEESSQKLFFHLHQPRACVRSAPLLIFLLFHCSSYLSDPAVYVSWF
jgi:hypothetical protein